MKKLCAKVQALELFLAISLGNTLLFLLWNISNRGGNFRAIALDSPFLFSDYFYHIAGSTDPAHMYSVSDRFCFPPLAYCMYWLLWRMNPVIGGSESILDWESFKYADNALLIFLAFQMVTAFFLVYCVTEYYKKTGVKYTVLLPVAVLFSYPFLGTALQRGNSVVLVAILLSLAWLWMDSESKRKQELAMILIAVAAGFKFYPAILGIAYVRGRDWKRSIRLLLYGVIAVFVPFLFFGGLDGMRSLTQSLLALTAVQTDQYGTVRGMSAYLLGRYLHMDMLRASSIGIFTETLFLCVSVLCFFLSKEKWQRVLFVSGILASYIASSFAYTSVYYFPALLAFLYAYQESIGHYSWKERLWIGGNTLAFGLIFSLSLFLLRGFHYEMKKGVFVIGYLLLGMNMLNVALPYIKKIKRKIWLK